MGTALSIIFSLAFADKKEGPFYRFFKSHFTIPPPDATRDY